MEAQHIDKMNEFNHKRHNILVKIKELHEEYLRYTLDHPENVSSYFKGINHTHFMIAENSVFSLDF